jgi:hypothetical protein
MRLLGFFRLRVCRGRREGIGYGARRPINNRPQDAILPHFGSCRLFGCTGMRLHTDYVGAQLCRDAEYGQSIAGEHPLDLLVVQTRQLGAFEHVVQAADSSETGVDGGEGIVGAKQHFVPDAVLLDEHEGVIQLKRAVVERGDIGVDIRVLTDGDDALALVGVA